jgi:two-component system chemotaxis response regulator CheB
MAKNILIIDTSAVIRRYLVTLLTKEGYFVDALNNSRKSVQDAIAMKRYSLIIIDTNMPDGLLILEELLREGKSRVLLLNTQSEADTTMEALELGAIDYIMKPYNSVDIAKISDKLLKKIRQSFLILPQKKRKNLSHFIEYNTKIDTSIAMGFVLIGASTGGPRLIEKICKTLPKDYPHAVCIVQHMPTDFTTNFAKRLNGLSNVEVVEADNGTELKKSRVIIAKGGKHLHIRKKLNKYVALLVPNTQERFFVPSVDEMFFSAAEVLPPKNILAIELTGIGDDGADGLVTLRKKGAYTIAESQESAVVYGMPKEAAERGGACSVLPFNDILDEIIKYGQKDAFKR